MNPVELQHLTLSRPLLILDLESTGTDPAADRVVELALLTLFPDRPTELFQTKVNPGRPIPAAATAVHGIRDADVRDAPTFAALAPDLTRRLAGCDLAGFGVASFDLPLLCGEFARTRVSFDLSGRAILDALAVYRKYEARTLAAAVRFYLGRDHTAAHSAVGDALASVAVLDAQVGKYELPTSPSALHAALTEVDVGGKFRRADGAVVFAFGKHTGQPLADVARTDPGYLRWLLTRPLLSDALTILRAALAAG